METIIRVAPNMESEGINFATESSNITITHFDEATANIKVSDVSITITTAMSVSAEVVVSMMYVSMDDVQHEVLNIQSESDGYDYEDVMALTAHRVGTRLNAFLQEIGA